MRGIVGWHGEASSAAEAQDALRSMSAVHGPQAPSTATSHGSAVASYGPRTQVYTDQPLLIALTGAATIDGAPATAAAVATLWRERPSALPQALAGPFSLAIIDAEADRALFAIDRIGIETLFLQPGKDFVRFASCADALVAHPHANKAVDPQGIFDYVYFHCVPSPRSIFQGLERLLPGQCAERQGGKLRRRFYWQIDYRDTKAPLEPLKREFIETLEASVARASGNNGVDRVGSFLSGGTDSSSVSGLLTKVSGQPAKTFSIGFDADGYDEMEYARIAERHFGLDAKNYYVKPEDVLSAIPQIARAYDEPFGNASAVPALFCARLAREHGVDVLLAGDGGDEIFGGNARYLQQQILDLYQGVPGVLRRGLLEPLANMPGATKLMPLRKLGSYIEQASVPLPDRMETYNFLHRTPLGDIFSPEFLSQVNTQEPLENLREVYQRADTRSPLHRMLHLDLKITLADNDLRKVCRMCELAEVEVRYPMLDDQFVEFSGRVPPNLKIRNMTLRWFFKEALKDLLPQEIIKKQKHGFGLPTGKWLLENPALNAHASARLEALNKRGIFRRDYIDALNAQHKAGHAHYYGVLVWVLMMLEEWMQQHGV